MSHILLVLFLLGDKFSVAKNHPSVQEIIPENTNYARMKSRFEHARIPASLEDFSTSQDDEQFCVEVSSWTPWPQARFIVRYDQCLVTNSKSRTWFDLPELRRTRCQRISTEVVNSDFILRNAGPVEIDIRKDNEFISYKVIVDHDDHFFDTTIYGYCFKNNPLAVSP